MQEYETLNIQHIKNALRCRKANLPQPPTPIVLNEISWENYKLELKWTDNDMSKYFIKSQYITGRI